MVGLSNSAAATTYKFSYEFPPSEVPGVYEGFGTIITGSFEGTDDGNIVTYASNLEVSLNGAAFPTGLTLVAWNGSGYVSGPLVFAFDAAENNFVISDCVVRTQGCAYYLFFFVGSGGLGPIYGRVGSNAPVFLPHLGA